MTRRTRLISLAVTMAVSVVIFIVLGSNGPAQALIMSMIVIGTIGQTFWRYREEVWFFVAMAVLAVAHAALVWWLPWPHLTRTIVMPATVVDYVVVYSGFKLLARRLSSSGSA